MGLGGSLWVCVGLGVSVTPPLFLSPPQFCWEDPKLETTLGGGSLWVWGGLYDSGGVSMILGGSLWFWGGPYGSGGVQGVSMGLGELYGSGGGSMGLGGSLWDIVGLGVSVTPPLFLSPPPVLLGGPRTGDHHGVCAEHRAGAQGAAG